jgi:hypothetical protein
MTRKNSPATRKNILSALCDPDLLEDPRARRLRLLFGLQLL